MLAEDHPLKQKAPSVPVDEKRHSALPDAKLI
jgi:hypothetical protein